MKTYAVKAKRSISLRVAGNMLIDTKTMIEMAGIEARKSATISIMTTRKNVESEIQANLGTINDIAHPKIETAQNMLLIALSRRVI
jgi:hypothetical protein